MKTYQVKGYTIDKRTQYRTSFVFTVGEVTCSTDARRYVEYLFDVRIVNMHITSVKER